MSKCLAIASVRDELCDKLAENLGRDLIFVEAFVVRRELLNLEKVVEQYVPNLRNQPIPLGLRKCRLGVLGSLYSYNPSQVS